LLILMSMSARFHDRDQTYLGRGEVIIFTLLASMLPTLLLMYLFTHTGQLGFHEKWQIERGLKRLPKSKCLRYRFSERWRWVWYVIVLACVVGMIVYILSIALMFDQNPWYFCQGETTKAWLIDFIVPYLVTVFVIEPVKILCLVSARQMVATTTAPSQQTETMELEKPPANFE